MPANDAHDAPSRRERLRRQTADEIKQRAFDLVDTDGAHDVTIASVGKGMGMTPPALYRYFPSREALLSALVVDAYADLGSTVAFFASRLLPSFSFWFDAKDGAYLGHRMPLHRKGPEVVLVRSGLTPRDLGVE